MMGAKSKKGGSFERWFAKRLSLWWTQDLPEPRDDIFWRTQNSGGRATARGKKRKATRGQYGDVAATDPIGRPFIDLVTIELKNGYGGYPLNTLHDLIDAPKGKIPLLARWAAKAERTSHAAESFSWIIVAKRDRKEPIVLAPRTLFRTLVDWDGEETKDRLADFPSCVFASKQLPCNIFCTILEAFFTSVSPQTIRDNISGGV